MKPRLLYIASTYSHICNFHRPYLREFADRGWEVHVACGGTKMKIPEAHEIIHVPFDKSISFVKNKKAFQRLRKTLREGDYTLVSTHTALASCFARLAVMGMKHRPLVACMVHGYLFDEETPLKRRIPLAAAEKVTAPVTDLVLTMNRWDETYARQHHLGKQIYNVPGIGVPFERLKRVSREDGLALRAQLGLSEERFLYIYAAEFSGRKNQETLLRALQKLPEQAALLLPGDGAMLEECKALARELGIAERVIFPGQIKDMACWYAAADAAASASRSEGLPFNIMEAMYSGLPVVASAVKGHTDLIEEEQNGLLYPYGDSNACAWQMGRILEQPELREQLSEQARLDVQRYALGEVLPQVMDCYARLIPLGEKVPEKAEKALLSMEN